MGLPDQTDIEALLRPYEHKFVQIIGEAWSEYLFFLARHTLLYPSSRAHVVWEWILQRALQEFEISDSVSPVRMPLTTYFHISDRVLIRFKKADSDGISRNIPTQSAMDYVDPQAELEGIPSVVRLDVVYILDDAETSITDIRIVFRNGNRVEWQYSIMDEHSKVVDLAATAKHETPESKFTPKREVGSQGRLASDIDDE